MADDSQMQLDYDESLTLESETLGLSKKPMDNLHISIDNDGDEEPSVSFVKTQVDLEEDTAIDQGFDPKFKVQLTSEQLKKSSYQNNGKLYENKAVGAFTSGVDITSQEARKRRKERAKRFGVNEEAIADKKLDIDSLYSSLGVTEEDLKMTGERQIRCDTIMLRGVDDLNTQDVFNYLAKHPPHKLEWIDDSSCNLVYSTTDDANRTLIAMSEPIKTSLVPVKPVRRQRSRTKPACSQIMTSTPTAAIKESASSSIPKEADDTIDLLTGITDLNDSQEVPATPAKMELEEGELSSDDSGVYMDESEVPPGKWRVATAPCPKAKGKLFMRLATKADVKGKGAERKSQYYRKHGNPNYGGLPGLISKSRKSRFRKEQNKILEQEAKDAVSDGGRSKVTYDSDDLFGAVYEEETNSHARELVPASDTERRSIIGKRKHERQMAEDDESDSSDAAYNFEIYSKRPKPMMKMAADEEAEKVERARAQSQAILASLDIRNKLESKRRSSHSQYSQQKRVNTSAPADLRSRLSRHNDW